MRARNVLLTGIMGTALFLDGCDSGVHAPTPNTKLKISIERQIDMGTNPGLRVWAQETKRSTNSATDVLTIICPCYIGTLEPGMGPIVGVSTEQLVLEILPNAEYNIDIVHLQE